jgi:multidrug efflux system membrane fusion protein
LLFVAGLAVGAIAATVGTRLFPKSGGSVLSESVAAQSTVPAVVVRTAIARAMTFQDAVDVRGVVTPTASVAVKSETDGRIVRVLFQEGSIVREGDTLFELDPQMAIAREHAAAADVQKSRSALEAARREQNRTASLVREGFLSQSANEASISNGERQQADLDRNLAALEMARIELQRTRISAPITGRVGRRLLDVGASIRVSDGTSLVEIERIDPVSVLVPFPEGKLAELRRAFGKGTLQAPLTRLGEPDALVTARLVSIANAIEKEAATIEVRFDAPNPGGRMWPGQSMMVHVPLGAPSSAVCVPREALFRSGRSDAVYVIGKGSLAELRQVVSTTGSGACARVDGLSAGEQVVIRGQDGIGPGVPVTAVLDK